MGRPGTKWAALSPEVGKPTGSLNIEMPAALPKVGKPALYLRLASVHGTWGWQALEQARSSHWLSHSQPAHYQGEASGDEGRGTEVSWGTGSAPPHRSLPNIDKIYHDFLPPPWRGNHVKSDNTHTIIQHTPLSSYTWHLRLDLLYIIAPFLQFVPTASWNGIPPLSRWSPPEGSPRKNTGPSKNWCVKLIQLQTNHVSLLVLIFRIVAQPPPSFLCCPTST